MERPLCFRIEWTSVTCWLRKSVQGMWEHLFVILNLIGRKNILKRHKKCGEAFQNHGLRSAYNREPPMSRECGEILFWTRLSCNRKSILMQRQ